jgi:ATP-binding cassette subfamily F protein 3
MEQELRSLEQQLVDSNGQEDIMNRYGLLSEQFEDQDGYSYPAKTRSILSGLGFGEDEFSQPVEVLSGGQQSRLALAKLLLSKPDVLLLDEPTNHLDIAAINWLEDFLRSFSGGLLMVSHDRRFLETLADTIYEMEGTTLELYSGNYSYYRAERELRREKAAKEYQAQQEYIKRTQDYIARNIEGQKTKQAQSRRKELAKIDLLDRPSSEAIKASFKFEQRRPSGRHVLNIKGLSKTFEGKKVFTNISFQLERGQQAGLIGPNGCGKTTLLEIICDLQKPDSGSVNFGHFVELAYFSQKRQDLGPENTAIDEIRTVRPSWTRGEVQGLLARFLFRGDDAFKVVKHMSGGEAGRLALAKLLLCNANLLVLDEPTNHLDIDSKEVLEEALENYPGTVLIVSHDRWFLNSVTDVTLDMSAGGIKIYQGNYDYWIAKKAEEAREREYAKQDQKPARKQPQKPKPEPVKAKTAKLSANEIFRRDQRIKALETEIAAAEGRQGEIDAEIIQASSDHQKLSNLTTELQELQGKLERDYAEWDSLTRELEENS